MEMLYVENKKNRENNYKATAFDWKKSIFAEKNLIFNNQLKIPRIAAPNVPEELLLNIIAQLVKTISTPKEPCKYNFVFCDLDLKILQLDIASENQDYFEQKKIKPGDYYTEETFGTNAIALAKRYHKLICFSEEFWTQINKKAVYSLAVPIKDFCETTLGYLGVLVIPHNQLGMAVNFVKMLLIAIESTLAICNVKEDLSDDLADSLLLIKQKLSPREQTICELLLKGYSSDEISDELGLTVATVRFYRKNIYKKCNVSGLGGLLGLLNR